VSARYERSSLILTSNLAFSQWGQIFGDQIVAAAMIDRIVHHALILNMNGPCGWRIDNALNTQKRKTINNDSHLKGVSNDEK